MGLFSPVTDAISSLTGANDAADAAKEGARLSADATVKSTEKNTDFQKWLWGEQKGLTQPWVNSGKGANNALMNELGFSRQGTGKDSDEYASLVKERTRLGEDFLSSNNKDIGQYFSSVTDAEGALGLLKGTTTNQDPNEWWNKKWGSKGKELKDLDRKIEDVGNREGGWQKTGEGGFKYDKYTDPSTEFRRKEAMKGIENSAFARGGGLSGGNMKDILRFNSDYASTEYGNAYSRWQNDINNLYNVSSMGANTAIGQSNQGTEMGRQVSNSILTEGNANSNMYSNIGNINASQSMSGFNTLMDIGELAASFSGGGGGGGGGGAPNVLGNSYSSTGGAGNFNIGF